MTSSDRRPAPRGGPRPDRALERDACGIGFVADVTGRTDRRVVELGLQGLAKLRHRGAFAADEQTGDGAGVLFPIPRYRREDVHFLRDLVEAGEYRPVIDRTYAFEDVVEANRYVETGQKTGNVVLRVVPSDAETR